MVINIVKRSIHGSLATFPPALAEHEVTAYRQSSGNKSPATHPQPLVVGRFAPSPSGTMHAGNIFSALVSWLTAKAAGGNIVLRIEDLDRERSKVTYANQIMRDFELLGLTWDEGPYYQYNRGEAYEAAFQKLLHQSLLYPCFCTRADILAASAPHVGSGMAYAGTCARLSASQQKALLVEGRRHAWRVKTQGQRFLIEDIFQGEYKVDLAHTSSDFIVKRSDNSFAYQLAVVVDDASQGITTVVRGSDLMTSAAQQRYLQEVLGLPQVNYGHVPLLVAPDGRRLSKRDKDANLHELLETFKTPEALIGHIARLTGLQETNEPTTPETLLRSFSPEIMQRLWCDHTTLLWSAEDASVNDNQLYKN
jgi:glutamyl-tRNA synthetase